MKIIVASEAEKELMQRFLSIISTSDIISNVVKDIDDEKLVSSEEYHFIENGFYDCMLEVGQTNSMTQEHTIISGICIVCGSYFEGIADGGDINYDEYAEYQKEDMYCEDCLKHKDTTEKTCDTCKYGELDLQGYPCCYCDAIGLPDYYMWTAKEEKGETECNTQL